MPTFRITFVDAAHVPVDVEADELEVRNGLSTLLRVQTVIGAPRLVVVRRVPTREATVELLRT